MTYASAADLAEAAEFYGVAIPTDTEARERLLKLATRDVQRRLAAEWSVLLLEPEQVEALRDATAIQAVYRAASGGEQNLALDDGIAALGGVSFSRFSPPRLSPEADEALAGYGLYARSGTVAPDPLDDLVG